MTGAAAFWWQFVPAVPDKVIPHSRDRLFTGYTSDGALVFARPGESASAFFPIMGPVEVVDSVTGNVLRRIGNEQAQITSDVAGSDHLILSQSDRWDVVDLRTGKVAMTGSPNEKVQLSMDAKLLATTSGSRVSMFEVEAARPLWTRNFESREPISAGSQQLRLMRWEPRLPPQFGQFIRVELEAPGGIQDAYDSLWLNSRTGEAEPRLRNAEDLIESPDGRYVLFRENKDSQLLSLTENRVLCRIPVTASYCTFNSDSTEIRTLAQSNNGWRLSRWSVPDGKAIGRVSNEEVFDCQLHGISDDGRAFVLQESDWGFLGSRRLTDALRALGLSKVEDVYYRNHDWIVQRGAQDESTLLLASDSWFEAGDPYSGLSVQSIGKADRFAVTTPGRVLIFRFDPPRNWGWLVGWGLGPILAGMAVSRWRSRRQVA